MIIGIVGHDGCGKTSIANYIQSLIPNTKKIALADSLKRDLGTIGIDAWSKPMPVPIRNLCRSYADAQMFIHGDSYWLNRANYDPRYINILDDLRQHHEHVWCLSKPDPVFIVIRTREAKPLNMTYRSVKECEELITYFEANPESNVLVIDNVKTPEGLSDEVKYTISGWLDELLINRGLKSV